MIAADRAASFDAGTPTHGAPTAGTAWERFFFPAMSPVRLAFMRAVCVALQLVWFGESLQSQLDKLEAPSFYQPQLIVQALMLAVPEEALRSVGYVTGLYWVTMAVGVFALLGLFTRVAMPAFALGTVLQIAGLYSYGEHHHPEAAYAVFLVLMAMAPCGRALSVDSWIARKRGKPASVWGPQATTRFAMWPMRTAQVFLAIAYFDAFLSKMIVGGVDWINGYTLQTYLLQDGVRWDRPVGVWLAQSREIGILFAVGALAFEALFFVILFKRFRMLTPVFLLVGTGMHLTIWLAQAAPFFQYLVLYLTWVPWERLWQKREALEGVGSATPDLRTQTASAAPAA